MNTPIHLTPFGDGGPCARAEVQAARALVAETIRHELDERHNTHWPRHRPSPRRRAAARSVAWCSQLVVITDNDASERRVIGAATCRTNGTRFGRLVTAALAIARRCTRGVVTFGSMIVLLVVRNGHTGIGALAALGIVAGLATSPVLAALRVRLADRATAAHAALFLPGRVHGRVRVLRHLNVPNNIETAETIVAALAYADGGSAVVTVPCCVEMGDWYSAWEETMWVPPHADVERTVLVFSAHEAPPAPV